MNDQNDKITTASCLCGAVRFNIRGDLRPVINCHCSQCRRTSGHFGAFSGAPKNALTFTEERGLKWFQSSQQARRGFCSECGSSLFYDRKNAAHMAIAAGSLDGITHLVTKSHIFTDDKGDYYELSDDLPRHGAYPG
ncbi:MAG: GFA family protein [Rhodospirillaceae bacterium]|nr:GFA family protein [Rhodospirillaceae bacterium]MBL6929929.1 GFA family protein [Rhodospirillales bacterium]MBL6942073.1 GFA family protein [Rhodospirillales bacterium]